VRVSKLPILIFIILFFCSDSKLYEKHIVNKEKKDIVGEIAYELINNKNKSVISKGELLVQKSDIEVTRRTKNLLRKMIKIHDHFYFGIASVREKPEDFSGFGLMLQNRSIISFSWEWFSIVAEGKAVKLQETGNIDFSIYDTDGLVEIDKIYFASDTTLRCRKQGLLDLFRVILSVLTGRRLVTDDWLCNIKKGSYIYWKSDMSN
jgi:hypothetical protein